MMRPATFDNDLLAALPQLRKIAYRYAGNASLADDLTHETLLRALAHWDTFRPGTNFIGWLHVICRNAFFNEKRNGKRARDPRFVASFTTIAPFTGNEQVELIEVGAAIARLPLEQRQALFDAGLGLRYDEMAEVRSIPAGTAKSRVSRARASALEMLA